VALTKRFYTNHKTVITAENMNDIQDAIIALEALAGIVPGEGEATRNISVVNRNGNFTLVETVGLPDGLYWFDNPVTFKDDTQTETFQLYGLVAKTENGWLNYDTGRACVTDEFGVLIAWTYTSLPEANSENEGKVLAVVEGKWEVADPQQVFPLEEAHVSPTNEPQELLPSDGYCGFSVIYVDAAPENGGWGDDYGGPVEDNTWGDEYTDTDVPTGNLDYSGGTDENPSYIPEIPGEGDYKVLFKNGMKAGTAFRFTIDGTTGGRETREITSDSPIFVYNGRGTYDSENIMPNGQPFPTRGDYIVVYSGDKGVGYKLDGTSQVTSYYADANGHFDFPLREMGGGNVYTGEIGKGFQCEGLVTFDVGNFATWEALHTAVRMAGASHAVTGDTEQFIAFVSKTPIYYDGTYITNADGSPMSIYNVDAADGNEWVYTGTTDGTNFPVSGYDLTWNNHDLKDMNGENVTEGQSGDPIPEMSNHIPVERNGTYSVDGNTMNGLVGAAQKVTGSTTPLSPTEATSALDDYMANPAEEMKW
jgi:hypothetical protein